MSAGALSALGSAKRAARARPKPRKTSRPGESVGIPAGAPPAVGVGVGTPAGVAVGVAVGGSVPVGVGLGVAVGGAPTTKHVEKADVLPTGRLVAVAVMIDCPAGTPGNTRGPKGEVAREVGEDVGEAEKRLSFPRSGGVAGRIRKELEADERVRRTAVCVPDTVRVPAAIVADVMVGGNMFGSPKGGAAEIPTPPLSWMELVSIIGRRTWRETPRRRRRR